MNTNAFHSKIKEMIELCSYDMYLITKFNDIKCTCLDITTKEGSPNCPMCLGIGYKIKIKKIRGASNEKLENIAGRGVKGPEKTAVGKTYFFNSKYKINQNDIIVDNNEAYYVFRSTKMRAFNGEHVHDELMAIPKRQDHKMFITNFNRILSKYNANRNRGR